MDAATLKAIEAAVQRAFDSGVDGKRYVDISRVPLICQSIIGIDRNLEELKIVMVTQDQFWPVKALVYGLVGLMLTALVGAIVMLVLK